MANEMEILGTYYNDNLGSTGWSAVEEISGRNICFATANTGKSVTAIDFTTPAIPTLIKQIVDAVNLNGAEEIQIRGDYAYVVSMESDTVTILNNINDPENMAILKTLTDSTNLEGALGITVVDNIGGYDRVGFVGCYYGKRVTAVDLSDPNNPAVIKTVVNATYLDGAGGSIYKDGYIIVSSRHSKCIATLSVSDVDNMSFVTALTDPVQQRLERISGVSSDDNVLYVGCSTTNTVNCVDITDPTSLSILGHVTDGAILDRPLVTATVLSNISFKYIAVGCYDDDRLVLINVTDPTNPNIVQNITDPLLNGADDVRWEASTSRVYLTCSVAKRVAVINIPLLETFMATIIKTWTAAVELAKTNAFGGNVADLAADQAYDYTDDVDLETNGYDGAQVLVEVMLNYGDRDRKDPQAPDDVIVDVFASLDGSLYDTVPYRSVIVKSKRNTRTQRFTMVIEDLTHFRIGLRTTDTNDTFDYRITHQTWLLTNA